MPTLKSTKPKMCMANGSRNYFKNALKLFNSRSDQESLSWINAQTTRHSDYNSGSMNAPGGITPHTESSCTLVQIRPSSESHWKNRKLVPKRKYSIPLAQLAVTLVGWHLSSDARFGATISTQKLCQWPEIWLK